MQDFAGVLASD